MVGALILSLPIAWDHEKSDRTAGFRTFSLVAVTSCAFMMAGYRFLDDSAAHARIMQGVIGGLGFLGGGAIIKYKDDVSGMSTAASIWSAGAIGMTVAYNQFGIAITLSAMNLLALKFGKKLKKVVNESE